MVTVAIDARLVDGSVGGVQQTILGLAHGLAHIGTAGERFLFLVYEQHDWLRPALRGPCQPLVVGPAPSSTDIAGKAARYVREGRGRVLPRPPQGLDQAGVEVVHFMLQRGFRTSLPNIYQPHDLQHLDHPERFHPLQRAYRRLSYRAMARQASRVAVMTSDAVELTARRLEVPIDRVIVVPWASVLSLYGPATLDRAALDRMGVPPRFLLYPAQSWEHKNHVGLARALARLRAVGMDVPVVCTGRRTAHWRTVKGALDRGRVGDLVVPLDFVAPGVLRSLYAAADALVFPSLYEGWGLPIVEALEAGLPVACSDISPLRELAGAAALRFDPTDPAAMAATISVIWTDEEMRCRLSAAAVDRAARFSWQATARRFRATYRILAGHEPEEEDGSILASPVPL